MPVYGQTVWHKNSIYSTQHLQNRIVKPNLTQKLHIKRINKVKHFIEQNLEQKHTLSKLAFVANFSTFHFQRIFKSVVGETPKQYIQRIRLEAAAHMMAVEPHTSILEVAIKYGFNSLESFSRAFKNYYKVSPDAFRNKNGQEKITILQSVMSFSDQSILKKEHFTAPENNVKAKRFDVEVVKLPPKKVIFLNAYLKDSDAIANSFQRVTNWANGHNLVTKSTETFALILDYPIFTPLDKCRIQTCMTVDIKPPLSGEVNYLEVPSRIYARFSYDGGLPEMIQAVSNVVNNWLPQSGYKINHTPAVLIHSGNFNPIKSNETTYQFYLAIIPE